MSEDPALVRSEDLHERSRLPETHGKGIEVKVSGAATIFKELQDLHQVMIQKHSSVEKSGLGEWSKGMDDLWPQLETQEVFSITTQLNPPLSYQETHLRFYPGSLISSPVVDIESKIALGPSAKFTRRQVQEALKKQGVEAEWVERGRKYRLDVEAGDIVVMVDFNPGDIQISITLLNTYKREDQLAYQATHGGDWKSRQEASKKFEQVSKRMTEWPDTFKINGSNPVEFEHQLKVYAEVYGQLLNALYTSNGQNPPDKVIEIGIPSAKPAITTTEANAPEAETRPRLEKMFAQLPEIKPEDLDHKYFIDEKEKLKQLESIKPFFVNIKLNPNGTFSHEVNREVVPYVYEQVGQTQRFQQAESVTGGDSGLFALCAVSAETPAKQAEVYTRISETVIRVHENNPALLVTWLGRQLEQDGDDFAPFFVFYSFDQVMINGVPQPRPGQEQLVAFAFDLQTNNYDFAKFESIWKNRMDELKGALESGEIEPRHIRWIEFLSHSIDKSKLFNILKST